MPQDDTFSHPPPLYARGDGSTFSRGPASESAELRGECPRQTLNALDAVSMARNMSRTALVNEILGAWAEKKRHELSLLLRLDGSNPGAADAGGGRGK